MTLNMFFRDVFQNCEIRNDCGGVYSRIVNNHNFVTALLPKLMSGELKVNEIETKVI